MMIKKISYLVVVVVALLSGRAVLAITATQLEVVISGKNGFANGETVTFDYSLKNNSNTKVDVTFIASLDCQGVPQNFLKLERATLAAGATVNKTYKDFKVAAGIDSQVCLAKVFVQSPINKRVIKPLDIVNSVKQISASVESSGGQNCPTALKSFIATLSCIEDKKTVFELGSKVYLNPAIESGTWSTATTVSKLYYPNGTVSTVVLPTIITPTLAGSYRLETAISKKDFLTNTIVYNFAVIASAPIVSYEGAAASIPLQNFAVDSNGKALMLNKELVYKPKF